jgi:hypothetical protein
LGFAHLWGSFPAEDLVNHRAFLAAGGYPITTRLHYLMDLQNFFPKTSPQTRLASAQEAQVLGECAAHAINSHDRTHADPALAPRAESYLRSYAENAVRGFTDAVLVPKNPELFPAFFALNYGRENWSNWKIPLGKFVLSAVGRPNLGTYNLLAHDAACALKKAQATHAWFTTQATNRAVIHTWEKLGAKLGSVFHLVGYADTMILSPQASGTMS